MIQLCGFVGGEGGGAGSGILYRYIILYPPTPRYERTGACQGTFVLEKQQWGPGVCGGGGRVTGPCPACPRRSFRVLFCPKLQLKI